MSIVELERSVVPACDVSFSVFKKIVAQTADVEAVSAYKFGVSFLDIGMKTVVDVIRDAEQKAGTKKIALYDHQKAGTDIPDRTPDEFMESMVRSGVDAVILFPEAGPATQYEWIKAAQDRDLGVIVGGEMTHPRFLQSDLSEGKKKNYTQIFADLGINRDMPGYLRSTAPIDMYELAARMGVKDFVMPGNKPDKIVQYKALVQVCGAADPAVWSPGLITQGGDPSAGAIAAGKRFHAISGSGIYKKEDMRAAALELGSQIA